MTKYNREPGPNATEDEKIGAALSRLELELEISPSTIQTAKKALSEGASLYTVEQLYRDALRDKENSPNHRTIEHNLLKFPIKILRRSS